MVNIVVRLEIDMVSLSSKEYLGGYEMPRKYVLRWEQILVFDSESGKEERWLVDAELGDVLEKVLRFW